MYRANCWINPLEEKQPKCIGNKWLSNKCSLSAQYLVCFSLLYLGKSYSSVVESLLCSNLQRLPRMAGTDHCLKCIKALLSQCRQYRAGCTNGLTQNKAAVHAGDPPFLALVVSQFFSSKVPAWVLAGSPSVPPDPHCFQLLPGQGSLWFDNKQILALLCGFVALLLRQFVSLFLGLSACQSSSFLICLPFFLLVAPTQSCPVFFRWTVPQTMLSYTSAVLHFYGSCFLHSA